MLSFPSLALASPTITSVAFAGSASAPQIELSGTGFGTQPTASNVADSGYTGDDYGNALYLCDTSSNPNSFCAGQNDGSGGWDLIGLVVNTYTNTHIDYALGSSYTNWFYPSVYDLQAGDEFTVHINGAACSGVVAFSGVPIPCGGGGPTLTGVTPGDGTVSATWTPVPAASGYVVAAVPAGNDRVPAPAAVVRSKSVPASAQSATLSGLVEDCHQTYKISVTPTIGGGPGNAALWPVAVRPSGIVTPGERPPYVVVLLDGIGSQEAGFRMDPYHPTEIGPDSYCPQNVKNGVPIPITTGTGASQLPNNAFRAQPTGPKEFFFKWNAWDPADDHGGNVPEADSNSTPRGLIAGNKSTYDRPTYSWMLDGIAATGAMILPYSYWGATLQGHGRADPTFVFNAYTDCNSTPAPSCTQDNHLDPGGSPDPSHQDYDNAVHSFSLGEDEDRLQTEIDSIEGVWPNEPIIIMGHSQGGLIAFETWRKHMLPGAVHHLFSLDSPINGVCAGRNLGVPCSGPPGYPAYSARFLVDPTYLIQDGGSSPAFRFIGTLGDEVRVNLPGPAGSTPGYETGNDTLQHQLLVTGSGCTASSHTDCTTRVDHISECQLPEQPWVLDRVTPAVTDQNRWIYDTGHFVVKWCPGNIAYFNNVLGLTNYGTP